MFDFIIEEDKLLVTYYSNDGVDWVSDIIDRKGSCRLRRTFCLVEGDIKKLEDEFDDVIVFILGDIVGKYIKIRKDILDIDYDVYFSQSIELTQDYFIATRNISILAKLSSIVKSNLYIDDDESFMEEKHHIPLSQFKVLIKQFPNTTEITKYAENRIALLIREYFDNTDKFVTGYENYLSKRQLLSRNVDQDYYNHLKLNLLTVARDTLRNMLDNYTIYGEKDWQERIKDIICVLFPKYVFAVREVNIGGIDSFDKHPDYILIDSNGYVDIMEIKKPDDNQVIRTAKNRNNYVPQKIFSDVIVQTAKYILSINTNTEKAKKNIVSRLLKETPTAQLRESDLFINNPKGIVLFGRSNNLCIEARNDFELIRRQYKDITEIMTYDDLLLRLNNIIDVLTQKMQNA